MAATATPTPTTFAASTVTPPTHTDTTTATAANSSLQNQSSVKKSKCHKYSETTTPSSAAAATATNGNNHSPTTSIVDQTPRHSNFNPLPVVTSRKSWYCRASPNHIASQLTQPQSQSQSHSLAQAQSRRADYRLSTPVLASPNRELDYQPASPSSLSSSTADSSCTHRIRLSPGRLLPVMDFTCTPTTHASTNAAVNSHTDNELYPSCFNKFNSALTAGLLNPLSPPPLYEKTRSSPTLFEMMASEPDVHPKPQISPNNVGVSVQGPQIVTQDRQASTIQRISDILATRSPGNQFNDQTTSDIKLTISSKDGIRVSMNVHCQILVAHSRFFAVKLSNCGSKQKRPTLPYTVEIADCDDVEIYIETLRLMYCNDLRKKLMKEEVSRVLEILKVSAAIGFDAGVLSCLEYLEAAPWSEDEEEKVASIMSELRLEGVGAGKVLKRVSTELTNGNEDQNDNEEVLMKLLHVVLEGKDEKARREMKGLVSKMLRENSSQNDLRKESLYSACDGCLQLLRRQFWQASTSYLQGAGQIARQADNLLWILEILIDRQIADDFLKTWASLTDLSELHSKVPAVHRFEVSRVTAMLFIGIGKGQILTSKDVRCLLLQTWLVPFYDDFDWMQRASKGLDRHLIEDSLGNTILTLPLARQQDFFLAWFDRFLNSGEDCPNIQRGFEVWWRRTFRKRRGEQDQTRQLRITASAESS